MSLEQTLKCMVVDDEPHAAELLELYVAKTPFLELVHKETDPWKAISYLKENKIDVLFLDIQMEGLTGLQLLDVLEEHPIVILTTAYTEYALKGYEYKVADYLLKPYSFDRFLKAVNAIQKKKSKSEVSEINQKTESNSDSNNHIFLKGDAKNKFHRIAYDDIYYIEGLRNYVQFNCSEETITTLQNMKTLENELPADRFVRIHKSYIVNVNKIKLVDGNIISIAGKTIPIGASYRSAFLNKLK